LKRQRPAYRNLKSLSAAREILFARFRHLQTDVEAIPTRQALGRVLANPVRAVRSVPAYHAAAMDGVAVRAATTYGAAQENPIALRETLEAVPVNTGDPLPAGTDAVVMVEKIEWTAGGIEIREAAYPWQNIRKAGEDIVAGEMILPARHLIRPHDQGALLASGVLAVDVFQKPRVLIIPTGDEIVSPEEAADSLPPGAILEVNGQVLNSMIAECGAEAILAGAVPDDPARIRETVLTGLADGFHLILIIAGSSAGTEDFTPSVLQEIGELLVHGVTVMPGKPTLLADVHGRPVIGVPGYPVSAVISFREFVKPLLYRIQGALESEPQTIEAVMGRKLPSKPGLEEHVRVVLGEVQGRKIALPLAAGAGMLTSLVRADGILRIPEEITGYSEGESVRVELLTPAQSSRHRLLAIGSHDLTIDLLASMIKEKSGGKTAISSLNVGSLGGLMALERGIAHLAGSHLLDTQTGEYNLAYVRRILPRTPVVLITLVHRLQGFMIAQGNPKQIQTISDLARPDVLFINRQAGSGTRILLDYELQKAAVDPAAILGYANEEYTHMSVAMAVASGRADLGLGVLAAAKALDLGFIPIARERYDLVVPSVLVDDERIRLLIDIIRSRQFIEQVLAMGGYEVEETGKFR
jgi:molybdenum cofactor synthesis domain-containing protein